MLSMNKRVQIPMIFGLLLLGHPLDGLASDPPLLFIDLDLGKAGIDSMETTQVGSLVTLAVRIENVDYLDTYGFQIRFDPRRLTFIDALPEDTSQGIVNILETRQGLAIGFIGRLSARDSSLVTVAYSLPGSDSSKSPSGGGLLALLRFRAQAKGETSLSFDTVELLDWNQKDIPVKQANGARLVILDQATSIGLSLPRVRQATQGKVGRPELGWLGQRVDLRGRRLALR